MTLALITASLLAAACGSGAATPGVASTGSTTTTTQGAADQTGGAGSNVDAGILFAHCMQTHGVPNFPEPSANGDFVLPVGTNTSSSTYQAAQVKCQKYMGGGLPGTGTNTHPTAAVLAQFLKVARCMRRHGIAQFPDPLTTMPSISPQNPPGVISDRDGAILVFPQSVDMTSPAFTRAAEICNFALTNHSGK